MCPARQARIMSMGEDGSRNMYRAIRNQGKYIA